jgi:DNA polymerase III epsilon subunit-like protein
VKNRASFFRPCSSSTSVVFPLGPLVLSVFFSLVSWLQQPIFFVDFEGCRATGIVEYGVVTVLGGEIVETCTRLCQPCGRLRPKDVTIHGLREEVLALHAPFADDWEYFAGLRERGPLAAHYAGVENALLKSAWPYPRNSPDFARPGERVIDWGPWIDTARIYAQLFPRFDSGRLASLVAACGLQDELARTAAEHCPPARCRYHAALYDALAGAVLLVRLARDAQTASLTIMQLLALSTLDAQKRDALQQPELF